MGCFQSCGRVIMIIFNIFFLIIGLLFLAGGLLIKFGSSLYKGAIETVEKSIEQAIANTGGGTVDVNLNLGSVTEPVAYSLIGAGVFIMLICFFGCCGACYKKKFPLILYIIPAIIIVVGEIVLVTLFLGFPAVIKAPLASSLKSGIQSEYEDLTGTTLVSQAWNLAMQQFKCCGANDYKDFTGGSKWNTTKYNTGTCTCTLKTPLACCKTLPTGATSSALQCAVNPTTVNNNFMTGCVDTVWNDYIISNKIAVSAAVSGLALFQVLLVVFAFVICCNIENEKMKKNNEKMKKNTVKPKDNNSSWQMTGLRKNKVYPSRF